MSRVKVTVAVFIAVVAFSAIAAGSASAGWLVGGKTLTGTKALKTTAIVDESAILSTPSLSLKITCAGLSGVTPEIVGGTSRAQAASLIFEACKVIEPTNCSISPTTVETKAIYGLLTLGKGEEDNILFEPQTPKTFATLNLAGANCSISGEKPVTGTVVARAPVGQLERTEQVLEGWGSLEQSSHELEVGGNKSFLEKGKALLLLASGEAWSFD